MESMMPEYGTPEWRAAVGKDDQVFSDEVLEQAERAVDEAMRKAIERCEKTDLLSDQCGCPLHRGGRTPQEEAELDRVVQGPGPWFFAKYPGWCERGEHEFEAGETVRFDGGPKTLECRKCTG
jgi:hypothetical protein